MLKDYQTIQLFFGIIFIYYLYSKARVKVYLDTDVLRHIALNET